MLSADLIIAIAIGYVGLLFLIAYAGDRRARRSKGGILRSPVVYTLAISVYCTSWTFYGAVGSAARNGLEYVAIYLGPTLVFVGWWFLLRKLVRIAHNQRITSIADLLSSRFGKSSRLGVLVTVIAVIGMAPYIALQLKAVTSSIQAIAGTASFGNGSMAGFDEVLLALAIAAALFLALPLTRIWGAVLAGLITIFALATVLNRRQYAWTLPGMAMLIALVPAMLSSPL